MMAQTWAEPQGFETWDAFHLEEWKLCASQARRHPSGVQTMMQSDIIRRAQAARQRARMETAA